MTQRCFAIKSCRQFRIIYSNRNRFRNRFLNYCRTDTDKYKISVHIFIDIYIVLNKSGQGHHQWMSQNKNSIFNRKKVIKRKCLIETVITERKSIVRHVVSVIKLSIGFFCQINNERLSRGMIYVKEWLENEIEYVSIYLWTDNNLTYFMYILSSSSVVVEPIAFINKCSCAHLLIAVI